MSVFDEINWVKRDVKIEGQGGIVFFQKDVEAPDFWTQGALNVVVPKYFRGKVNADGTPAPGRETSIRQIVSRIVETISGWVGYGHEKAEPPFKAEGWTTHQTKNGLYVSHCRPPGTDLKPDTVYFETYPEWLGWKEHLCHILIYQKAAFNSPVWFNVGVDRYPQCSACFILRLEDHMLGESKDEFDLDDHGLLAAQVKEGIIFSRGSGSGINLSRVRSSKEWLSGGGKPTGPGSFARGLDAWAASIKSGGKTRRAAKMLILDVDHPDILDFIRTKAYEEKIAGLLLGTGLYGQGMDSEAYAHAFHQNSNLSVRVSDRFMQAVIDNQDWNLISRSHHFLQDKAEAATMLGTTGRVVETLSARGILAEIAQKAWECADPGIQFADTINRYHTCADEEMIFASNPCSEYLFLDETSCNLASVNLRRFFNSKEDFNDPHKVSTFVEVIQTLTVAMDAIVSCSKYPTRNIKKRTQEYRTLGLGYSNLGGMLMEMGVPYDSEEGRIISALCMSTITAVTYSTSAWLADRLGPFPKWELNKGSCARVMRAHAEAHDKLAGPLSLTALSSRARSHWSRVSDGLVPLRNAQATVIAPTGTISFMMDCETTGIEPDFALVKRKNLSGGGTLTLDNPLWVKSLENLGYSKAVIEQAGESIAKHGDIIPGIIRDEHRKIFQTAAGPNALDWRAHVLMMASTQPFVSGAISKTVNLPKTATVDEIYSVYLTAWSLGIKAIAVYRDGSKFVQALVTGSQDEKKESHPDVSRLMAELDVTSKRLAEVEKILASDGLAVRRKAPKKVLHERHKFDIDGHEGYLFIGFYPDGNDPCEIFVGGLSQIGSSVRGFVDCYCILFSWCLQYGIPLEKLIERFRFTDFHPKGVTGDEDVRICRSIPDFIVRKLEAVLIKTKSGEEKPQPDVPDEGEARPAGTAAAPAFTVPGSNAGLTCRRCGSVNVRIQGSCTFCYDCKDESGGCFG